MQRCAYALAKYTGQRKSDLVLMTRADRKSGLLCVKQSKTDAEVHIPEHRELIAELTRGNSEHMSLLTTSQGKAFDATYFGAWFAEAIEEARLPEDCVLHGLRKTAARMLAEAGCSEEEIKAVTGHTTSTMVSYRTRAAAWWMVSSPGIQPRPDIHSLASKRAGGIAATIRGGIAGLGLVNIAEFLRHLMLLA